MQPLATTRRMMTWFSMCPADESSNAWQKRGYIVYSSAILIINVTTFAASLTYCLKFISIDFEGATFGFMVGIGEFSLIYFMIAAIQMRHQIGSIFTSLATIYTTNENEDGFRFLAQANNASEWMWSIYFKYFAISLAGMATTSLLSVFYCYLTRGELSVDHLYKIGNYVLPWNQTTTAGYFGEIGFSILNSAGYLITNGTAFLPFISMCLHHQAFYKMFKHSIDKSEKCDAKLLCDLIRFHISAKDWFLHSANVYSSFVMVQLICNIALMTVCVFYLDLQWQQFDNTMVSLVTATSVGISILLFYCYFGNLATESYVMMSDCVYNMNWYEQPNEVQRYFILMIANVQKPLHYHGFEVAKLNLEMFVKLFRTVISYYIVIKTMATK